MPLVTRNELLEIVPELRAMAATAKTPTVRDTLNLLADRYAAMAGVGRNATPSTDLERESPAGVPRHVGRMARTQPENIAFSRGTSSLA